MRMAFMSILATTMTAVRLDRRSSPQVLQMEKSVRFGRMVFLGAGIWGILLLTPLYFTFDLVGRRNPPGITHPDFYYGFVGVALAWQLAFLIIGGDPVRFRPIMLAAMVEKFTYVVALTLLFGQHRIQAGQLLAAGPDLVLGVLFVLAYLRTPHPSRVA